MDYEGNKGELFLKESVYRIDPSGEITKITEGLEKPNGLCFSPDYKKVYIVDTGSPKNIRVYDVDGKTAKNGKVFATNKGQLADKKNIGVVDENGNFSSGRPPIAVGRPVPQFKDDLRHCKGGSDGIRCDVQGNLYITTETGVQVYSPAGKLLGTLVFPEQPANCDFGGPGNKTLFVTAQTSLYKVELEIPGHIFGAP
jgi:gluconolactonase